MSSISQLAILVGCCASLWPNIPLKDLILVIDLRRPFFWHELVELPLNFHPAATGAGSGGQVAGRSLRGLLAEGRVGPFGVVVGDPGRDQIAGMGMGMCEVAEQRLVQKPVAHPAVSFP